VRRALAVLAAVATLTTTGIIASNASATTNSGVTVTGRNQYLKPGCAALPAISYAVPAATESWTLTANVSGPGFAASAETGTPYPATGTMSIVHCGSNGPGVFKVDATYQSGADQPIPVMTSYTVSRAPARVTLRSSRTSVHTGQNITLTGATSYLDGASYRAMQGWVTLQWRGAGTTTWHDWKSFWTDGSGTYSKTYPYPFTSGIVVRAKVGRYWTTTAYSPQLWVARTADTTRYANCTALHLVYAHGVGRSGAVDKTTGTPVTTFYRNTTLYNRNTHLDRDKDGIACEKR
jgi:Excalibur calcium-binding domain